MKIYAKAISDKVTPLPISTPFIKGETLTSWILRASFNQGCDYSALLFYHWSEYKLLHQDFDKGFNHIDPKIHEDMAILMQTSKDFIDAQTLINYNKNIAIDYQTNQKLKWVVAIPKFNSKKYVGQAFCPRCFQDGKCYLQRKWRYSWYIYCDEHHVLLSDTCPHCNLPYQPHLIKIPQNSLTQCSHCNGDLAVYSNNKIVQAEAYELQQKTQKVLEMDKVIIWGKVFKPRDWFELIQFYMNFLRKGLLNNGKNLYSKALESFHISIKGILISKPKTGLPFDSLPINERMMLLSYTNKLLKISVEDWLNICQLHQLKQSSFKFSRKCIVPPPFFTIYDKLLVGGRKIIDQSVQRKLKPKSSKAVLLSWERIQVKIERLKNYGEIKRKRTTKYKATDA